MPAAFSSCAIYSGYVGFSRFMALSGRQAGSTVTGKLLSAASFSCHSSVSAGSSVVQIVSTLLIRIRPRAE